MYDQIGTSCNVLGRVIRVAEDSVSVFEEPVGNDVPPNVIASTSNILGPNVHPIPCEAYNGIRQQTSKKNLELNWMNRVGKPITANCTLK